MNAIDRAKEYIYRHKGLMVETKDMICCLLFLLSIPVIKYLSWSFNVLGSSLEQPLEAHKTRWLHVNQIPLRFPLTCREVGVVAWYSFKPPKWLPARTTWQNAWTSILSSESLVCLLILTCKPTVPLSSQMITNMNNLTKWQDRQAWSIFCLLLHTDTLKLNAGTDEPPGLKDWEFTHVSEKALSFLTKQNQNVWHIIQ